ncbi:MAG: histidine phosphatase family protein [Pseudomonadota bacterium]
MGRIYLLRHGQADLFGADYDRLSDLGEAQARAVGAALAQRGVSPKILISGGLRRQSETARLASEAAGWAARPEQDPDWDEYRTEDLFAPAFPDTPNQEAIAASVADADNPRRAFQAKFETAFASWLGGHAGGPDGAETMSWAAFRARGLGATKRLAARLGPGETAVAATSGGVIAAILQSLLDAPDDAVLRLHNPVYNGSLTRLMTQGDTVALSGFNDISHLEAAGGAALVTYR